jgi:DNA-binding CsgD family transcriptional regulator
VAHAEHTSTGHDVSTTFASLHHDADPRAELEVRSAAVRRTPAEVQPSWPEIRSAPPGRHAALLGRAEERALLDGLLADVRGGQSAVLVIRGSAGSGKTALLHYCARQASGFRVARVCGVEAELELPFAAVHQLCTPMLGGLEALPEPQRTALGVALGLCAGEVPNRFLVALAVLSLLAVAAEDRPLLCLIDDAHWIDDASAEALGFVARRVLAESVAIVFAARNSVSTGWLCGLPELPLEGLAEQDAHALLASAVPGRLDDRIRDRIVAETGGNPLALLELPRAMSAAELAGGFDLPAIGGLPEHMEKHYLRRFHALPEDTQRLVLLAAAEPAGDAALVWAAAHRLGIACGALVPAVEARLTEQCGEQIRFRHPLVRSAVYRGASQEARLGAHQALAEVTDPERDADRRAWHRAMAASGPCEEVAAELERAAECAQTRGGFAAAAAFLERAADLTPDPATRTGRALAAAEAKHRCGEAEAALQLLAQAEAGPLDDLARARVHLLRARTAFGSNRRREAPSLMLAAARELEPLNQRAARDTYLAALSTSLFAGRLAGEVNLLTVARAAREAPSAPAYPQDLLLDGLALLITEGYPAGADHLKDAVRAFRTTSVPATEAMRWLWPAAHAAHDLWDDESWADLSARHACLVRDTGALYMLPTVLNAQICFQLFAGQLTTAASLVDEVAALTDTTIVGHPPYGAMTLAAFRGREADVAELVETVSTQARQRGEGMGFTLAEYAKSVLSNGLGRYREACESARMGAGQPRELALSNWCLPELVEAAIRSDQRALAEDARQRLRQVTAASPTDWALGIQARGDALVSVGDQAEGQYRRAIEHLGRTRMRAEHARAQLLFGEWLRREGRRVEARECLRNAYDMFAEMGMEAFAERARRERLATGETIRKRRAEASDDLTPQEAQIAQLARAGLTNPEIGGQLFLSPRTVEWHLKKIFTKLGINSRRELRDALPSGDHEMITG